MGQGDASLTLVLKPQGRGNWKPLVLSVVGERAAPLLVRVGEIWPIGGINFRIVSVNS